MAKDKKTTGQNYIKTALAKLRNDDEGFMGIPPNKVQASKKDKEKRRNPKHKKKSIEEY